MKSDVAKSYEKMWHKIHDELLLISSDRYNTELPELNLLVAIIIQAAKDKDLNYFKTELFYNHAQFLKISPIFIAILVKRAWNLQESGEIWVETECLMEDE